MDNLEETLKSMLKVNRNSDRLMFETDDDRLEFIKHCELVYKKDTRTHMEEFKNNDYEGNVDERRWYRLACYLMEKGYEFK